MIRRKVLVATAIAASAVTAGLWHATASAWAAPDVLVQLTSGPITAHIGQPVTHTVEVAASGEAPEHARTQMTFSTTVPLEGATATATAGTCHVASPVSITCEVNGELSAEEPVSITITGRIPANAAAGQVIYNTATVVTDGPDPDGTNNTSSNAYVLTAPGAVAPPADPPQEPPSATAVAHVSAQPQTNLVPVGILGAVVVQALAMLLLRRRKSGRHSGYRPKHATTMWRRLMELEIVLPTWSKLTREMRRWGRRRVSRHRLITPRSYRGSVSLPAAGLVLLLVLTVSALPALAGPPTSKSPSSGQEQHQGDKDKPAKKKKKPKEPKDSKGTSSSTVPHAQPDTATPPDPATPHATGAETTASSTTEPSTTAPSTTEPSTTAPSATAQSTTGQSTAAPSGIESSATEPSATDLSTPGQSTPGQSTPGQSTPGQSAPAAAPGTAAPGTAAPGTAAPGTAAPGTAAPAPAPAAAPTRANHAKTLAALQRTLRRAEYLQQMAHVTVADLDSARARASLLEERRRAGTTTPKQVQAAQAAVAVLEMALANTREELKRMQAHIEKLSTSITATRFAKVVDGQQTSAFGNRFDPYYKRWQLHAGVDLAAAEGTPVKALTDGVVTQAGWSGGYGNLTCLDHGERISTCYAHQSAIAVAKGQNVTTGQEIGKVGNTGASIGAHLHFEVRLDGRAVDPTPWLQGA